MDTEARRGFLDIQLSRRNLLRVAGAVAVAEVVGSACAPVSPTPPVDLGIPRAYGSSLDLQKSPLSEPPTEAERLSKIRKVVEDAATIIFRPGTIDVLDIRSAHFLDTRLPVEDEKQRKIFVATGEPSAVYVESTAPMGISNYELFIKLHEPDPESLIEGTPIADSIVTFTVPLNFKNELAGDVELNFAINRNHPSLDHFRNHGNEVQPNDVLNYLLSPTSVINDAFKIPSESPNRVPIVEASDRVFTAELNKGIDQIGVRIESYHEGEMTVEIDF